MPEENSLKTRKEIINDLLSPFQNALNAGGINEQFLIKQFKQEFKSREPKVIKVKGAVNPDTLRKGFKIIAQSGEIIHSADGGQDYSDGETIIEYHVRNIGIAQKARMDAQKLLGLYPVEEHKVTHIHESALEELLDEGK
jgi:hypothetical protein